MQRHKQKGFTIIELMIAMGILAFGILGFTFLNSRALSNRTFSRDLNRATVTAEQLAENLVCLEYDDTLLADDNSDAVATKHPLSSASNGDTDTIAGLDYTVSTKTYTDPAGTTTTDKWYTVQSGKQRYHLRWEVTTGNSMVSGSPDDKVKLIRIFTAFEKKDPKDGSIILGGYNPAKIGPTILTFKTE